MEGSQEDKESSRDALEDKESSRDALEDKESSRDDSAEKDEPENLGDIVKSESEKVTEDVERLMKSPDEPPKTEERLTPDLFSFAQRSYQYIHPIRPSIFSTPLSSDIFLNSLFRRYPTEQPLFHTNLTQGLGDTFWMKRRTPMAISPSSYNYR